MMTEVTKMNYKEFVTTLKENIFDYLPDEYKTTEIAFEPVKKVNLQKDALIFKKGKVAPTIYTEPLYDQYMREDMDSVMRAVADMLIDGFHSASKIEQHLDISRLRDSVVPVLINTSKNDCTGMPHREVQDLTVIYRWIMESDGDVMQSARVTSDLARIAGLTEEDLYEVSQKNVKGNYVFANLCELIGGLFEQEDRCLEESGTEDRLPKDLYVLTNKSRMYGASALLDEELLYKIGCKLGTDYYILPSSIHELIIVPIGLCVEYPEYLASMVREINRSQVMPEEVLSDHVYKYELKAKSVSIVA